MLFILRVKLSLKIEEGFPSQKFCTFILGGKNIKETSVRMIELKNSLGFWPLRRRVADFAFREKSWVHIGVLNNVLWGFIF